MKDSVLQSPGLRLCADSNVVLNYKRDSQNYITQLFGEQLPAIKNGFFNVYMSKNGVVNPHWHTNVNEMIYVICGEVVTSVFNPYTQQLVTCKLKPGQVSILPKGWFHWIVSLTDHTHVLTIFDEPTPDVVYISDFLRYVPKEIMHLAYCVNGEEFAKAVEPIQESVILGPPLSCCVEGKNEMKQMMFPQGGWGGHQASGMYHQQAGYTHYPYSY